MEKDNMPITELELNDRPRERMLQYGKSVLSHAELLAILIGSGMKSYSALTLARHTLKSAGSLKAMARWDVEDFCSIPGIGQAKAIRIAAAFELGRRFPLESEVRNAIIQNSSDAYDQFAPVLSDLRHEEFWVLYLSNANAVMAREKLSQGGMTGTVTDLRLLFRKALTVRATGVILAHNHPSGNLLPSDADKRLTSKAVEAGRIMDIAVLDHLVISPSDYLSFADEGWISVT